MSKQPDFDWEEEEKGQAPHALPLLALSELGLGLGSAWLFLFPLVVSVVAIDLWRTGSRAVPYMLAAACFLVLAARLVLRLARPISVAGSDLVLRVGPMVRVLKASDILAVYVTGARPSAGSYGLLIRVSRPMFLGGLFIMVPSDTHGAVIGALRKKGLVQTH